MTWSFVGNATYAACQWAILVALARVGTPTMVGQYALGLAVATPVMIFSLLHLRQVLASDAADDYDFAEYRFVRTSATTLGLLVVLAIVAVAGYPLETAAVIFAVGLSKAFDGVSDIYWGLSQKREQMQRVGKSLILRNVLSLVALVAAVVATDSVVVGAFVSAACSALILVAYDVRGGRGASARRSTRAGRPHLDRGRLTALAWRTLPLGVATMLVALNANIPRYFISAHFGEGQLGVYAAVASLMVVGITMVTAVADSATPHLARHLTDAAPRRFARVLAKLVVVGLLLGGAGILGALVGGKTILRLLFGDAYAQHDDLLLWTMLIAPVNYTASFLGYGMTALREFRVQPLLIALSSAVSVVASFLLVPAHGLIGAAWATGLSLGTQLCGSAAVVAIRMRQSVSRT